jgi:hypothetical protein
MINARSKGKRGEYEVIKLLQPVVNKVCGAYGYAAADLERNLTQARGGGFDISGIPWLALEVKRHENLGLSGIKEWWAQTRLQSKEGQEPVLFYRPNNTSWLVRMYGYLAVGGNGGVRVRAAVTVDLDAFLLWFEQRLIHDITKGRAS